jgi:hypothetical protein
MIENPRGLIQQGNEVTPAWRIFFDNLFLSSFALYQSGTTTQRPTTKLWVGRPYFDTTLGYQIHYNGTGWVDSAGNSV